MGVVLSGPARRPDEIPDRPLRITARSPYQMLLGVGGIGTGCFFALEGNHDLGREESRPGRLLDVRDYCKLHIITHYTAVLLHAEGADGPFRIVPMGRVGRDAAGDRLMAEMQQAGMDTRFVLQDDNLPTMFSVCFQYPDGSGGNITTSESASSAMREEDLAVAESLLQQAGGHRAMVLAAPEAPLAVRGRLLSFGTRYQAYRVAAFASAEMGAAKEMDLFSRIDLLAVNEDEASTFVGRTYRHQEAGDFLDACARTFAGIKEDIRLLISVGKRGAWGYENGAWAYCAPPAVKAASTAGAGDALLGATIAAIAAGVPFIQPQKRVTDIADATLETALEFAVCFAALTVTSPHTIHPDADWDLFLSFLADKNIQIRN